MLLGLELTADGYRWQDDTCYMWYQNKKVIKMVSVVVRDNIPFATNEHRSMIIGPPIQIGYTIDDKWRARLGVIVRQKVKKIKSFSNLSQLPYRKIGGLIYYKYQHILRLLEDDDAKQNIYGKAA